MTRLNIPEEKHIYPNSRLRLLATAVAAFPPANRLLKSSLTLSRNAMGTCLPADSTATTQYAAESKQENELLHYEHEW